MQKCEKILLNNFFILLHLTFITPNINLENKIQFVIDEELPIGYFIGNLWQTSTRNNETNSLYRLSSNSDFTHFFSINYTNGHLFIASRIDREQLAITLKAYDNSSINLNFILIASNQLISNKKTIPLIIDVNIVINDINDNAPTFPLNTQNISILESVPIGNRISLLIANDIDAGQNGIISNYKIVANNSKALKLLQLKNDKPDQQQLFLKVVKELDRETIDTYIIKLIAEDNGTPSKIGSMILYINVLDVNDNAPKFTHSIYNLSLPFLCDSLIEFPVNKSVLKISATDKDSGKNGLVVYNIQPNVDEDSKKTIQCTKIISINETSGELFYNSNCPLSNFPSNEIIKLQCTLIAIDKGVPKLSSRAFLDVTINKNVLFQKTTQKKKISEAKNEETFEVVSQKLIVRYYPDSSLDYGIANGTQSNNSIVAVITIIDLQASNNNQQTNLNNKFNKSIELLSGNTDNAFFLRNGDNFAILYFNSMSKTNKLKFELKVGIKYNLLTANVNQQKILNSTLITVYIRRKIDQIYIIQNIKLSKLTLIGANFAKVKISNNAKNTAIFEILSQVNNNNKSVEIFLINKKSGVLQLKQKLLDNVMFPVYKLIIRAKNSEESIEFSDVRMNIYIVEDTYHSAFKLKFVSSKCPQSQNVKFLEVNIVNSDVNCNNVLNSSFYIQNKSVDSELLNTNINIFKNDLIATFCQNKLKNILNYDFCDEKKSRINFKSEKCGNKTIKKNLVEKFSIYLVTISQNISTTSEVLNVNAIIESTLLNSVVNSTPPKIIYSISKSHCFYIKELQISEKNANCVENSDTNAFKINSKTGKIYLQNSLKNSTHHFYAFDIIASAKIDLEFENFELVAKTRVHIFIKKKNNNPPYFIDNSLYGNIRISEKIGTKLICSKAYDIDDNYNIQYFLVSKIDKKNLKYFSINKQNGCIYLKFKINNKFYIGDEIKFQIGAKDSDENLSTNNVTIYFKIIPNKLDVPTFKTAEVIIQTNRYYLPNETFNIITINSTQVKNNKIDYFLIAPQPILNLLKIDNSTGMLSLNNIQIIDENKERCFIEEMNSFNSKYNYYQDNIAFKIVLKTLKFWTTISCILTFSKQTNDNLMWNNTKNIVLNQEKKNSSKNFDFLSENLNHSFEETLIISVDELSASTIGAPIARIGFTSLSMSDKNLEYFINNKDVFKINQNNGIITLNTLNYLMKNNSTKLSFFNLHKKIKNDMNNILLNARIVQYNFNKTKAKFIWRKIHINFPEKLTNDVEDFQLESKQTLIINNYTLYTNNDEIMHLNPQNISTILFYSMQNPFVEVLLNGNVIIKSLNFLKKIKFFYLPLLIQNLKTGSTFRAQINFVIARTKNHSNLIKANDFYLKNSYFKLDQSINYFNFLKQCKNELYAQIIKNNQQTDPIFFANTTKNSENLNIYNDDLQTKNKNLTYLESIKSNSNKLFNCYDFNTSYNNLNNKLKFTKSIYKVSVEFNSLNDLNKPITEVKVLNKSLKNINYFLRDPYDFFKINSLTGKIFFKHANYNSIANNFQNIFYSPLIKSTQNEKFLLFNLTIIAVANLMHPVLLNITEIIESIPSILLVRIIGFNNASLIQKFCELKFILPQFETITLKQSFIIEKKITKFIAKLMSKKTSNNISARFNKNCFNFGFITYKLSEFNPYFVIDLYSGLLKIIGIPETQSFTINILSEWQLSKNETSKIITSKCLKINIIAENYSIPLIVTNSFLIQENNQIGDLIGHLDIIDKYSQKYYVSINEIKILYQIPNGFDFFFNKRNLYTKIIFDRELFPENIELMIEVCHQYKTDICHQKSIKILIGDENDNSPECNDEMGVIILATPTILRKQIECYDIDSFGVNSTINLRLSDNNPQLKLLSKIIKFNRTDMIINSFALRNFLFKSKNLKQNQILELNLIAYDGINITTILNNSDKNSYSQSSKFKIILIGKFSSNESLNLKQQTFQFELFQNLVTEKSTVFIANWLNNKNYKSKFDKTNFTIGHLPFDKENYKYIIENYSTTLIKKFDYNDSPLNFKENFLHHFRLDFYSGKIYLIRQIPINVKQITMKVIVVSESQSIFDLITVNIQLVNDKQDASIIYFLNSLKFPKQNVLLFNISKFESVGNKIGKVFNKFFTNKLNNFELFFEFVPYFVEITNKNNFYHIKNNDFPFEIDSKLGIIKISQALNYKKINIYSAYVIVKISSKTSNHIQVIANLSVHIMVYSQNFYSNDLLSLQENITFSIIENAKSGFYVGALKPLNYKINSINFLRRYRILNTSQVCLDKHTNTKFPFLIDFSNNDGGFVILVSNHSTLDYENCSVYHLKFAVEIIEITENFISNIFSNNKFLPKKIKSLSEHNLHIYIEDENDNLPMIKVKSKYLIQKESTIFKNNSFIYELNVPATIDISTKLINFIASDKDDSASFNYVIDSWTNELNLFDIDDFGNFYTIESLMDYSGRVFNICVTLRDAYFPLFYHETYFFFSIYVSQVPHLEFDLKNTKNIIFVSEFASINYVIGLFNANLIIDSLNIKTQTISYCIINQPLNFDFSIDNSTGLLKVNKLLDREILNYYNFIIEAKLNSQQYLNVLPIYKKITVLIEDEDDNPPIFLNDFTNQRFFVLENASVGHFIVRVPYYDVDNFGLTSAVRFKIFDGDPNRFFYIELFTGRIYVNRKLDYEEVKSFVLNISMSPAFNNKWPILTRQIKINVIDVNDEAPQFLDGNIIHINVAENITGPYPIILRQILAFDPEKDANGQITYTIVKGDLNLFNINLTTGILLLLKVLDREMATWHELIISAMDYGTPRLSNLIKVQIYVVDINDNAPIFEHNKYIKEINILELKTSLNNQNFNFNQLFYDKKNLTQLKQNYNNLLSLNINQKNNWIYLSHSMIPIIQVTAFDNDLGLNGFIQYYLKDVNGMRAIFLIESISGLISIKKWFFLNMLTKNTTMSLIIVAKDAGKFEQFSTEVEVILKFFNAKLPQNLIEIENITNVFIPNDAQKGDLIHIITPHLITNKFSYIYSLNGYCSEYFSIDPSNGALYLVTKVTMLPINDCVINVKIQQQHDTLASSNTTLILFVKDSKSYFPHFVENNTVIELSVLENSTNELLYDFEADLVNISNNFQKNNTYSIVLGDFNGNFYLNPFNGKLFSKSLDRENCAKYKLYISAYKDDEFGNYYKLYAIVIVNILDLNDNYPIFDKEEYIVNLIENQLPKHNICTVHASDSDYGKNSKLYYSLIFENNITLNQFSINSTTGEISSLVSFDREFCERYQIGVEVIDAGVIPLKSRSLITINILDENDNAPKFLRLLYAEILEDAFIDSFVIQVTSDDVDSPLNAQNFYELYGYGAEYFNIDKKTGIITLAKLLDREQQSQFRLKIRSFDAYWSVSTTLKILILDVNDNEPQFSAQFYEFNFNSTIFLKNFDLKKNKNIELVENFHTIFNEFEIGAIHANDADIGENARIKYYFLDNNKNLIINNGFVKNDFENIFKNNENKLFEKNETNFFINENKKIFYNCVKNKELTQFFRIDIDNGKIFFTVFDFLQLKSIFFNIYINDIQPISICLRVLATDNGQMLRLSTQSIVIIHFDMNMNDVTALKSKTQIYNFAKVENYLKNNNNFGVAFTDLEINENTPLTTLFNISHLSIKWKSQLHYRVRDYSSISFSKSIFNNLFYFDNNTGIIILKQKISKIAIYCRTLTYHIKIYEKDNNNLETDLVKLRIQILPTLQLAFDISKKMLKTCQTQGFVFIQQNQNESSFLINDNSVTTINNDKKLVKTNNKNQSYILPICTDQIAINSCVKKSNQNLLKINNTTLVCFNDTTIESGYQCVNDNKDANNTNNYNNNYKSTSSIFIKNLNNKTKIIGYIHYINVEFSSYFQNPLFCIVILTAFAILTCFCFVCYCYQKKKSNSNQIIIAKVAEKQKIENQKNSYYENFSALSNMTPMMMSTNSIHTIKTNVDSSHTDLSYYQQYNNQHQNHNYTNINFSNNMQMLKLAENQKLPCSHFNEIYHNKQINN